MLHSGAATEREGRNLEQSGIERIYVGSGEGGFDLRFPQKELNLSFSELEYVLKNDINK